MSKDKTTPKIECELERYRGKMYRATGKPMRQAAITKQYAEDLYDLVERESNNNNN